MSDIVVVDNFFHNLQLKLIEKAVMSLPWTYTDSLSYSNPSIPQEFRKNDKDIIEEFGGLYHMLMVDNKIVSDHYHQFGNIKSFLENKFNLDIKFIQRMKFQLTLPLAIQSAKYLIPHADFVEKNSKLIICYINDCDGDTVIFNELHEEAIFNSTTINTDKKTIYERCSPVKNKAIMIDSRRLHATSYSRSAPRIIMTSNVLI